jgi:hypothetical protein
MNFVLKPEELESYLTVRVGPEHAVEVIATKVARTSTA